MNQGIERIKILASEIKDNPLLKIVEYLLTREDMNDKYLNEEKSLSEMVDFIRAEAKKEAKNGMAWIEDEVVYGWAVHYFDESNESLKLDKKETLVEKEKFEKNAPIKNEKKQVKRAWIPEGQLSLFDVM